MNIDKLKKIVDGLFKLLKNSFKEIEFFKKSNWRNLIRNPIFNNFVIITLIITICYLGWKTYEKSHRYFNENELWGAISEKYNTTSNDVITKQEDSFTITTVYDSVTNTRNSKVSSGNSKLLKSNDKIPLKYIIEKESFDLGDVGDFIGGYFGFWIGIIGALLTFLAFYVQYRANRDVQKQFRLQQFENQLNKMIDVYINNKDKFSIPGYKNPNNETVDLNIVKGNTLLEKFNNLSYNDEPQQKPSQKMSLISIINSYTLNESIDNKFMEYHTRDHLVFQKFLVELKVINRIFVESYKLVKKTSESKLSDDVKKELFVTAYKVFFDGLNKFAKDYTNPSEEYVAHAIKLLKAVRKAHKKNGTKIFKNFYRDKNEIDKNLWLKLNYEPFKGYLHFLPQYFRGLYSIVNFVVNESKDLNLSDHQKKIYLRTVRSTMSDYEQTLLFYNWYSEYGLDWEDKDNKFLTKFKMIHNLRRITLIEDDLDVKKVFNFEESYFNLVFPSFYK